MDERPELKFLSVLKLSRLKPTVVQSRLCLSRTILFNLLQEEQLSKVLFMIDAMPGNQFEDCPLSFRYNVILEVLEILLDLIQTESSLRKQHFLPVSLLFFFLFLLEFFISGSSVIFVFLISLLLLILRVLFFSFAFLDIHFLHVLVKHVFDILILSRL